MREREQQRFCALNVENMSRGGGSFLTASRRWRVLRVALTCVHIFTHRCGTGFCWLCLRTLDEAGDLSEHYAFYNLRGCPNKQVRRNGLQM